MIPTVLVVYHHRPMCVGLFYANAFRQAGCRVITLGPQTPRVYGKSDGTEHVFVDGDYRAPDIPLDDEWIEKPLSVDTAVALAGSSDAAGFCPECVVDPVVPDLVVMVDQYDKFYLIGHPADREKTKFAYIAVENWNPEQRERWGYRSTDAEFYMISHSDLAPLPENTEWIVFGADPFIHPHLNMTRDKLACWIGSAYDPRPSYWNALRYHFDMEGPVHEDLYRDTLVESRSTLFGRTPSYKGNAIAYNRSLCALSCSHVDFIPMRVVEAFAMGCVFLSDDVPSIRKAFGAPYPENPLGIWMVHERTADSMAAAIERVIDLDPDEVNALRDRALATTYRKFTYSHAARRILERVGLEHAWRMV